MPTFSLVVTPRETSQPRFNVPTTLSYRDADKSAPPTASVITLSPVGFSAQNRSTSELLRTL